LEGLPVSLIRDISAPFVSMAVAPSENPYNARSDSAERLKFMLANPAPVMGAFLAFSKSEMICEFYDGTVVLTPPFISQTRSVRGYSTDDK
jgi:hypothetical protein